MTEEREQRCEFHSWGDSTRDESITHAVRWETRCTRCGVLLCYSLQPFMVNGKQAR